VRSGEEDGEEGALIKDVGLRRSDRMGCYVHALFEFEKVDGLVNGRVP
jgi:hypothetical protein